MRRNTYYADPAIGAATESLVNGIFGGQGESNRARAGLLRSQRDGADLENEERIRRLNASRRQGEVVRGLVPGQSVTGALPEIYGLAFEGGDSRMAALVPGLMRGVGTPLVPTAVERDRLAQAAGESYQNTEGGRVQAEAEAARRTGISAGATVQAARIGADGALARTRLEEDGRRDRFERGDAQPGTTIAGTRAVRMGLTPPPADGAVAPAYTLPEAGRNVTAGGTYVGPTPGIVPQEGPRPQTTVRGAPTISSVQGEAAQTFMDPAASPEQRTRARSILPSGTIEGQTDAIAGRQQIEDTRGANALRRTEMVVAGRRYAVEVGADMRQRIVEITNDGRQRVVDTQMLGARERQELEAASRQAIARMAIEGRAAEGEANRTTQTAIAQGNNQTTRDVAAGNNQTARDVATTNAGARAGAATQPRIVPGRAAEDIQRELAAELSTRGFRLDGEAERWVRARAEEIYADRANPAGGSSLRAAQAALDEFRAMDGAPRRDWGWNPLSSQRFGLPPSLVPGGAPRPAAPAAAPAPPRPAAPAPAADPLAQARAAIAAGAPRNAVIQRLQQNGIDPAGL
jgi:hypothetical protein